MTPRLIYLLAVLYSLQCVKCADLQGLANSAQRTAQVVEQSITNASIAAENVLKSANTQASQLIDSTLTRIRQMAEDVGNKIKSLVQAGRNFQTCVSEQSEAVRSLVPVAGQELQACVQAAVQSLREYSADIKDIGAQALQLLLQVPARVSSCTFSGLSLLSCLGTVFEYTSSKGLLLVSSSSHDLAHLTVLGLQLPGQLAKCGASQVAKVATQLAGIGASIDACVTSSAAAADA
ncbi:uncharacterized protein LOC111874934 [Cryptotermes secundus]|uniref:uncharacterized protein LOC111874934 n=1 Tax=Cryptotermes secundus TaxID=105785 RepID=UPI000CD7AF6B|nr:uncharacterized protein LOC111874934 [Cryptotermes secundus]